LALRLRQLSAAYSTLDDIAAKCGVSRGALSALRTETPPLDARDVRPKSRYFRLEPPGNPGDAVKGSLERFGLEYCEIEAHLIVPAAAQEDLCTFFRSAGG
jgi:hypothetical protein